ncbi:glycosyltransferase family 4 protein [Faecalibaculum rodentium]|jgi:1,2-diacylglycerol-3-alpha-glucose alpha-1,2-galactosyltransferase|uniref:glycosyltransferase family 4 protein n=1 Tax=Faecalibaculum rodentium TaxID=1702221 RepID=UPI0023F2E43E|nr:glycosyltransferase family 4 protein [Faecalibaculum rodentium]
MENGKLRINMYSSADKVAGQGVGSAYEEQVALVRQADDLFDVEVNRPDRDADIQHFHTIDPIFFLRMRNKKPLNVAYCHFLPDTVMDGSLKVPKPLRKLVADYIIHFYNAADHLIVVNPSFIPELEKYGIPRRKIRYIPNYVSREVFHPLGEETRQAARKQYGIDAEAFVVLGAGQVQTRKGVKDFVETAKRLPHLTFVWAGGFSFGKMTDGYEELKAIMDNPPANVVFTGIVPREKMAELYNMTDVLFVPSYNELFPMTILEAANLHVPMVIRDLDLYKEILQGHYMKGDSVDEFTDLLHTLSSNPKVYEQYQDESRKISQYYSAEHVLTMWKAFYVEAWKYKDRFRT